MTLNEIADYSAEIKHYDDAELAGTIEEVNAQLLSKSSVIDAAIQNGVNAQALFNEYKHLKQHEEVLVTELVRRIYGGEQYIESNEIAAPVNQ